jgi:hypothetical protein
LKVLGSDDFFVETGVLVGLVFELVLHHEHVSLCGGGVEDSALQSRRELGHLPSEVELGEVVERNEELVVKSEVDVSCSISGGNGASHGDNCSLLDGADIVHDEDGGVLLASAVTQRRGVGNQVDVVQIRQFVIGDTVATHRLATSIDHFVEPLQVTVIGNSQDTCLVDSPIEVRSASNDVIGFLIDELSIDSVEIGEGGIPRYLASYSVWLHYSSLVVKGTHDVELLFSLVICHHVDWQIGTRSRSCNRGSLIEYGPLEFVRTGAGEFDNLKDFVHSEGEVKVALLVNGVCFFIHESLGSHE